MAEKHELEENDIISVKARVIRLRKDDVEAQLEDGNLLRIHHKHATIEHKAILGPPENKALKPGKK